MRCYSVLSRNTILIRAPWRHCAQWSKPDVRGQIPYDSPSVKAKVARSCLALCNPMDYTVHGILQARILEWVAFPFPGDLPNPGIKPRSPALQVDSLPAEPPGKPFYLYKLPRMGKLIKTASWMLVAPGWGEAWRSHCRCVQDACLGWWRGPGWAGSRWPYNTVNVLNATEFLLLQRVKTAKFTWCIFYYSQNEKHFQNTEFQVSYGCLIFYLWHWVLCYYEVCVN